MEDVDKVKDAIEANYAEHGWSETTITDRLADGQKFERVVAAYWRMRANAVLYLVNTSESGSSRGNDSLYPRFKALAEDWEARAVLAEAPSVVEVRQRLGSIRMKRV